MTEESERTAEMNQPPRWLLATAEDFRTVDLNEPIAHLSDSADVRKVSDVLNLAAKEAEGRGNVSKELVYLMLGAICSFHFKPSNRNEPYGPSAQFGNRRTAAPEDFKGAPLAILSSNFERISHPAVRARVADLIWLLDRKQAVAGWEAIASYTETVKGIREGRMFFRIETGAHGYEVAGCLRRGIQIAKVLGWDKDKSSALRQQVSELRAEAARKNNERSFSRLGALDLDYRISDPTAVAAEAVSLADLSADLHMKHGLLHIAARAHRLSKDQSAAERDQLRAAECLVEISESQSGSAIFKAHWLERAIAEMHHISNTKERRRVLKHKLVDVQGHIVDELSSFGHSEDISDLVEFSRAEVAGKPLGVALGAFGRLSRAPDPSQLEEEARQAIAENPLSSIFATTQYDANGKPVYRDQGLESDDEQTSVKRQISQSERLRRSLAAQGCIEPARLKIAEEHYVDEDIVSIVCSMSPFVPPDRRAIFTSGLVNFFHGNMIGALHVLVPQLENSLRHVLRLHGHDATKLNDDMTQEELALSVLLEKLRPELDAIFGEHMITDIDNLLNYRGGPNLRNRVAHGLVGQWEPHSDDAIYACWLIFQLCCIPLLPRWQQVERRIDYVQGVRIIDEST